MTYRTTITHEGNLGRWFEVDYDILVEYTYHPFCAGATDGRYGPKIEPDEPAHIEIDGIEGIDFELTETEIERIEEEIYERSILPDML